MWISKGPPARSALRAMVSSVGLAALLSGCVSSGLSPREQSGGYGSREPGYANYVYSMYTDGDSSAIPIARQPMRLPIRVGVVQLGEVAPPQSMLEELRRHADLVATAQPMPGIFEIDNAPGNAFANPPSPGTAESQARKHIGHMRRYARDLGLDYILLFGGNVDYGSTSNGLSMLDLTVVGAFVVPSKELAATGRASGSLIDVTTGRVVLAVTSEAKSSRLASSFSQDGDKEKQLFAMREELISKLAKQFVQRLANP